MSTDRKVTVALIPYAFLQLIGNVLEISFIRAGQATLAALIAVILFGGM